MIWLIFFRSLIVLIYFFKWLLVETILRFEQWIFPLFLIVQALLLFFGKTLGLLHDKDEEDAADEAESGEDEECSLLTQSIKESIWAGGHYQDAAPKDNARHRVGCIGRDSRGVKPEVGTLCSLVEHEV